MSGEPFPDIKSKHSLVAKHVTEPVWAKLGNAKTETSGEKSSEFSTELRYRSS